MSKLKKLEIVCEIKGFYELIDSLIIMLKYRSEVKNRRLLVDLGTGLLIGGGIGNAIDRILYN